MSRTYALAVPADAASLKHLRAFFASVLGEVPCPDADGLVLALDEAFANVVKHRAGELDDGLIQVETTVDDARLRIRIGRFCRATDVEQVKPRDLEDVRPGGLGTHFIAKIMDRVAYEPEPCTPGRMALVLEKSVPKGE